MPGECVCRQFASPLIDLSSDVNEALNGDVCFSVCDVYVCVTAIMAFLIGQPIGWLENE